MEEFIIRNYVYRNLCDMLFKMNKLYPELMPDEMLLEELECLKEYVSTLKIKDRLADTKTSTQETDVVEQTPVKKATRKSKKEKEVTPAIDVTTPLFTFDASQFQSDTRPAETEPTPTAAPKKTVRKAKASQDPSVNVPQQLQHATTQVQTPLQPNACQDPSVNVPQQLRHATTQVQTPLQPAVTLQCLARVVTASRAAMSYDYISYPVNTTVPVYGRQCKNVRLNDQTQFCRIHDKKCEYGIFADEPREEVKNLCFRKYNRLKELENNSQGL